MAINAFLMIKLDKTEEGNGRKDAIRELEAMPNISTIEPVSGEYDLIVEAAVDSAAKVRAIAEEIQAKEWVKSVNVLKVESAEPNPLLEEICSLPGGECVRWCMQCGMCSASCPNVNKMDYSPRKIIALIRAGRRYDVLTSNTMWVCASCYLCTARCPKDVKITELMHSLERLVVRHAFPVGGVTTPAMYRAFVASIKNHGRVHEMGMMMQFYIKTNPFAAVKMLPVALQLFLHQRMSIMPRRVRGVAQIKTMLKRAQTLGGME